MKAMVEDIPEILARVNKSKVSWIQDWAYLKIRPTLPPEAPPATPSARAKSPFISTVDTVPFVGGIGAGAFGAFPR